MCHHFVPMFMRLFNVVSKDFATVYSRIPQPALPLYSSSFGNNIAVQKVEEVFDYIVPAITGILVARFSSSAVVQVMSKAHSLASSSLLVLSWPWLSCVSITVVVGENRIYYT